MSLSRADVLANALQILDTFGLADLTMRRLASNLDVHPGALYWHFENKQTLLDAMAEQILEGLPNLAGGDWGASIQTWAARLHTLLRRYRGGAELVASALALRSWDNSPARPIESLLVNCGIAPLTARAAASGVISLVLGHAVNEEQMEQLARLGVRAEGPPSESTQLLDEAVAVLVSGLRRRVEALR